MKPFNNNLSRGSIGPDVYRLQGFLEREGYGDFVPTGYFGDKTEAAVERFQIVMGVDTSAGGSGVFGPRTRAAANGMISDDARKRVLSAAESVLGTDASPADVAPDEYGCAETVCDILAMAGVRIGTIVSTYALYGELVARDDFSLTDRPAPGDVVISPTGYGNGSMPNGHVGIVGDGGSIMSNSSATGNLESNYTMQTWRERYVDRGGFPMRFFRRLY